MTQIPVQQILACAQSFQRSAMSADGPTEAMICTIKSTILESEARIRQDIAAFAPIHAALEKVDIATELSLHCSVPVTLLQDIDGNVWVDVGEEEEGAAFQPSAEQARMIGAYLWKWADSQDQVEDNEGGGGHARGGIAATFRPAPTARGACKAEDNDVKGRLT